MRDIDEDIESNKSDLELMVGKSERILWRGRPNKKCYILEGIFNPMLPFALVWLLFDSMFFFAFFASSSAIEKTNINPSFAIIPIAAFLLLHLMPVWIYLAGVLFIFRKYKHTEYIVTDKGVYISGGIFAYTCQMKPYTEVSRINIHRGIFDQQLNVGDVVFTTHNDVFNGSRRNTYHLFSGLSISDIPDYQKVFELVKELQTDVFSDTMYPNDLRPEENHGYKTKYKGL